MIAANPNNMTPRQIRKVLRRHRGSVSEIAKRAGVSPQSVSIWLTGRQTSANIRANAVAVATECLDLEQKQAEAQTNVA